MDKGHGDEQTYNPTNQYTSLALPGSLHRVKSAIILVILSRNCRTFARQDTHMQLPSAGEGLDCPQLQPLAEWLCCGENLQRDS